MRKKLFKNKQKTTPKTPLCRAYWNPDLSCESALRGAKRWFCQCYTGSSYFGLARASWELFPASPRAGLGSEGEFLTPLKQNCQPEVLPLYHKEGRSLALLFCKVPGYVYEVTCYYSRKVTQLPDVTDRPIFLVLHGFCHGSALLVLHCWAKRGKEKSSGFGLNCCFWWLLNAVWWST